MNKFFLPIVFSLIFLSCNDPSDSKLIKQKEIEIPDVFNKKTIPTTTDSLISDEDKNWIINNFKEFIRKRRFNGSVLVAKKNQILLDTTVGFADFRKRIPLSDTSAIQMASITKPVTATVILQLLSEGKLQLSDVVTKHIPNLPKDPYASITIEMLLSHQSGLAQYYYYCDHIVEDKSCALTNEDLVQIIGNNDPNNYYPPGKKFYYCNTNYVLLALVAERIEERHFSEIVHNRIFEPAGMKHSFIIDIYNEKPSNLVYGNNRFNRIIEFDFLDGIVGDKGMFSTARDLYKFDQHLNSCNILSDSLFQIATQPSSKIKRDGSSYGYGWRLRFNEELGKIIYHSGWWHGNRHIYFKIPSQDFTVILLSNSLRGSVYNLNELLSVFYDVN